MSMNIGLIVNDRCQASSVFSVIDLFMAANYALGRYFETDKPFFHTHLIGLAPKVEAYCGNCVDSVIDINDCERPNLVILPGAFEAILGSDQVQDELAKMSKLISVVRDWHDSGTTIAGICTGNFILASADIAQGRPLTCHWASENTAHTLFPRESFKVDQLLIDHGDMVSAGGAMAVSQLVLYLISRFHSRELALATGKLMMVELNLDLQSRFAIFKPLTNHADALITRLQKQIEASFREELNINVFADKEGISARQLFRRFKNATGETPLSYLQRYRVEQVKLQLESTSKPINNLIWDVGYEDPTSFRRLFKRLTGLTMQEYRHRFSYSGAPN